MKRQAAVRCCGLLLKRRRDATLPFFFGHCTAAAQHVAGNSGGKDRTRGCRGISFSMADLQRGTENELYFTTRAKLVELLRGCDAIDVNISCAKKGKFWRCRSSKTIKSWAQGWGKVETEFTVVPGLKLDVALLKTVGTSLKELGEKALKEQALDIVFPGDEEMWEDETETEGSAGIKEPDKSESPAKENAPKPSVAQLQRKHPEEWALVQSVKTAADRESEKDMELSAGRKEWSLPPIHSPAQQYAIHRFARHVGMYSHSTGWGENRLLTLSNLPRTPEMRAHSRGHRHRIINTPMQGVAAVEICWTSDMNKDKLLRLNKARVPWIEIKAEPGFHPKSYQNQGEGKVLSLEALQSSDQLHHESQASPWRCEECSSNLQDSLEVSRLISIVDVYILKSTLGGFGRFLRKSFSVLERKERDEETNEERVAEVLLLEEGVDIHNNARTELPPKLIGRARGGSYESLQDILNRRVESIKAAKWRGEADIMTSTCVAWPGLPLAELRAQESQADTSAVGNTLSIKPPGLNVDIGTLFAPQYIWDIRTKAWKQAKGTRGRKKKEEES